MPSRNSTPLDDFRQAVLTVAFAPFLLGRQHQLVGHHQRRLATEAALGLGGSVADGGKGTFDRVRSPDVLPMFRREVAERSPFYPSWATELTWTSLDREVPRPNEKVPPRPLPIKTATVKLIADRIRDLTHRKTQAEIASETGFSNANMLTFLKNGRNKVPIDRVPQ